MIASKARTALKRSFSKQGERVNYQDGRSYNSRWLWKMRNAYFGQTRHNQEHTYVHKPEDSDDSPSLFNSLQETLLNRVIPYQRFRAGRMHRASDKFQTIVLPTAAASMLLFTDISFGFTILGLFPLSVMYVRYKNKTEQPDFQETQLFEMIFNNAELSELFSVETMHVLDHYAEFDAGFPDVEELPEFQNSMFQFFNSDANMASGHFTFGDVQSGATMQLKFKTMPIQGPSRFEVGEPFFMIDVVAEVTHEGVYKEVVLVDRAESLAKHRPFLQLVQ